MRAGEDDLAGRVVVGDGDAAGVGDLAARPRGVAPTSASIEPLRASPIRRPRRTTSSSASSRLRTPAATSAASSPSEWPAPALRVQVERVPADDGGAEDRGLCEAGVLLHAGEGVLADELGDLLEQLGRALGDQVAHLGGMAPLAREERRGLCCVAHTCTVTHAAFAVPPSLRRYPLVGGCRTPSSTRSGRDAGPSAPLRRGCARRACGRASEVCSLTVCGLRKSRPAISRLVAPRRDGLEHLALALGERRARRAPRAA